MKLKAKRGLRLWAFMTRPKDEEFNQMLNNLIGSLGMHGAAAVVGVPMMTLQGWCSKKHRPTAASKKTIWLIHTLIFKPTALKSVNDIVTWGRFSN